MRKFASLSAIHDRSRLCSRLRHVNLRRRGVYEIRDETLHRRAIVSQKRFSLKFFCWSLLNIPPASSSGGHPQPLHPYAINGAKLRCMRHASGAESMLTSTSLTPDFVVSLSALVLRRCTLTCIFQTSPLCHLRRYGRGSKYSSRLFNTLHRW